jgi:hypothetical protein
LTLESWGRPNVLTEAASFNDNKNLGFIVDPEETKFFSSFSPDILEDIRQNDQILHLHNFGITL